MPIILCVDDSEADRKLMGGLLKKEVDWLVQYAGNAQEAYEAIEGTFPDVVVTDLLMPQVNGLELLRVVREKYPHIPVILATSHGSEDLAMQALDQGAASYVPKDQLVEKLRDTIEQVLGLAHADGHFESLHACLSNEQFTLELTNDPRLFAPLIGRVQQSLIALDFCHATQRMHIGVALEEALLNALYHGNLELPSADYLRHRYQLRHGVLSPVAEERLGELPYQDRRIFVHASIGRREMRVLIRDQGRGFDTRRVPAAHDPGTLQEKTGRGLVLMRNFVSQVEFNELGNEVTMSFRRQPIDSSQQNGRSL
jgi:CheY-like chemotaxis protein/anti-sigma regulatory factor (Ser/Thr protein kinase)